MRYSIQFISFVLVLFTYQRSSAQVKYDEGSRMINGIQLLQDKNDANAYYYIPRYPKLATNDDGTYQILCLKYVGKNNETTGGLFHALLEFSLPEDSVAAIQAKLQKEFPAAKVVGPVRMSQPQGTDNTGEKLASFQIISATLANKEGKENFTRSVITSGYAPFTPGSRAAVAALLNRDGATVLWNSFSGAASDVSVSLSGTYEAYVKGYNAVVTAEVSTVYNHFSRLSSFQEEFTKDQSRKIIDDLRKDNKIKIEVFDRSAGLGIKTDDMDGIMKMVTDKLLELMFDTKTGWAKDPEREKAIEAGQIAGRRERGYFWQVFGGADNTAYVSDNQYVLKNRKDINVNTFYLNLSKSTTIRVPVNTTGNIAGLYKELSNNPLYFRVIDMEDPDFQTREVFFQVDGESTEAFTDVVNFATVSFRKKYHDNSHDNTQQLMFSPKEIKEGKLSKTITYPRLGDNSSDWLNYEYRIEWGLQGTNKVISMPLEKDKWIQDLSPTIPLVLPFKRNDIEIDADMEMFKAAGIVTAVVTIAGMQNGKSKQLKKIILRSTATSPTTKVTVFRDENSPVVYAVKWYTNTGSYQDNIQQVDTQTASNGFILLVPPSADKIR